MTGAAGAPTPTVSTPPPSPTPAPSPSAHPALDDKCTSDAECAVLTDDVTGPHVCCPGCTNSIANVASIKAFRASCTASPPGMCPPIGCAMPIANPKCVSGRCVDEK